MTFGPAEDQNNMQMWCEGQVQKFNNYLVIATERKSGECPYFPQ